MSPPFPRSVKPPYALGLIVAVQVLCTVFLLGDVINEYRHAASQHFYIEMLVTLSLCAAIVFESRYLVWLLRRKAHLERSVSITSAAIHDIIEAHFETWKLTAAEEDIAMFLVKGLSIAEIAALRGNAEGTVKFHLNAIYRKSGAKGRGEFLSLIIDGLIGGPDGEGDVTRSAALRHRRAGDPQTVPAWNAASEFSASSSSA